MIKRRKTAIVRAGSVILGGKNPIIIQTMLKIPTTETSLCIKQIKKLIKAGCGMVRIAVPGKDDTRALAEIIADCPIPVVADVHFSAARAIEAIEAGAAKIRLNPGNIKDHKDIIRIIDAAKANSTAIRTGVNEASIRDLKKDTPADSRTGLMLKEIKKYVRIFEKRNFTQLVLSAKSSNVERTIAINRKISESFDYPIHLGLTHAGLACDAEIPSAVAIGTLLAEGIGDTVRVSVAGDPVTEIDIAKKILASLGIYKNTGPELIVCPTCGRTQTDVISLAKKIRKGLTKINKPIRIAVMGCVVNGPGEAADADIAVCAQKTRAVIYKNNVKVCTVSENKIVPTLLKLAEKY